MTATVSAGSCQTIKSSTFMLETGTCGLQMIINGSTPSLQPTSGTPSNRYTQLQFQLQNTCDTGTITIPSLEFRWNGGPNFATARITDIVYNGAAKASGLSAPSGSLVTMTPVSIGPGLTSFNFNVIYSQQLFDGTLHTTWTSILAPADETLTSPITP
jgi:hypothetical protein